MLAGHKTGLGFLRNSKLFLDFGRLTFSTNIFPRGVFTRHGGIQSTRTEPYETITKTLCGYLWGSFTKVSAKSN